jgi:hypothetical protein
MEPPLGFVHLRDAVDLVGRKVYGPDWQPLSEFERDNPEIIVTRLFVFVETKPNPKLPDPKIEHVITLIAEKCEAGGIEAAYRHISGVGTLDSGEWRVGWRNYFATGEIILELPLVNNEHRPSKTGGTSRWPHAIFLKREHVNQLIEALSPQKSRAGAPPKHDWDA